MAPISYRVRSWLRGQWRVAAALALVVALAGGAALTLTAGATRTLTAPDRYSRWRGDAFDVTIEQSHGPPRTAELEALPATTSVEMSTFVFGGLTARRGGADVDALVFVGTIGPFGTRLVDGRLPDPAHPQEFMASKSLVDSIGARLGDRYDLTLLTQAQADAFGFDADDPAGPSLVAELVGVMDGPSDLEDGYTVAVFPPTLLDEGDVGVSASFGVASLADGVTLPDLRAELDGLPGGEIFGLERASWISSDIRAAVRTQGQGLAVLAVIALAAALVVLGQLFSRQLLLTDDERQVLRSVGLGRSEVAAEAVGRAAVTAVAGAIGAVVIAYLCSALFPLGFVERVEPHPGRRFDVLVHAGGPVLLAVALLVWVGVAMILDARPSLGVRSPGVAERLAAALSSAPMGTGLRFAMGRTAPRARSAVVSLGGLALVLCVLFGALTFGANLGRLVTQPAIYGANYDTALGQGATEVPAEMQAALEGSDDVAAVTLYGTTTGSVGTVSLDIVGMEPRRGGLLPEVLHGRLPEGDDEIALGSLVARELGVRAGDEVVLSAASGARSLVVTGIALVPPVGGADALGRAGLVSRRGFLALDPSATMSVAALRLSTDDAARARLADLLGTPTGPTDPPPAIGNLRRVRSIPFMVAAVVGALALLSLGHLMVVAVRRRRHDLAILQALGATSRWLTGALLWQATITTAVVLVVAAPVGSALGGALYRGFVDRVGARTDVVVPLGWLALSLAGLMGLANLIAAVPARRRGHARPATALAEG